MQRNAIAMAIAALVVLACASCATPGLKTTAATRLIHTAEHRPAAHHIQVGLVRGGGTADAQTVADEIVSRVEPDQGGSQISPSGAPYGYAGVKIRGDNSLTLYWVGAVPADINSALADGSANDEQVVSASYTFYAEHNAGTVLAKAANAGGLPRDLVVGIVTGKVNGSGVVVSYSGLRGTRARDAQLTVLFTKLLGMPARASYAPPPVFE